LLVTVCAWNVERTKDERLAGQKHGSAIQTGLPEDRILHADAGLFIRDAGLRYAGAEAERGLDVEAYILVLHLWRRRYTRRCG
jgi:hypothetical protein